MDKKAPEIILVEDDPSVVRALRRLLELAGFRVRAFDRPSSLLTTSIPESSACLIFDVHLPEMTGVELYEKLVQSGSCLPLILMTAHFDDATLAMTQRINSIAVLAKPFCRADLLDAIHKGLNLRGRDN